MIDRNLLSAHILALKWLRISLEVVVFSVNVGVVSQQG